MRFIRPPLLLRLFSPEYLNCQIPVKEKVIYLTFDDGPIPEVTPDIVKVLDEFKVKATFFVVGDNVRKHPDIFSQLLAAGHAIGNHTYSHLNGWQTSSAAYADDVLRCNTYINSLLFRPPYGRFTPSQYLLLRKRFRFILWSVLTYDFHSQTTPEECLKIALEYSFPGAIVVFHDHLKAKKNVLYALPRYLENLSNQDFSFAVIPHW